MPPYPEPSPGQAVFAGLLVITGLVVAVQSVSYGLTSGGRMGPGAATFIVGLVLAASASAVLTGALLAIRRHRRGSGAGTPFPAPPTAGDGAPGEREPVPGAAEPAVAEPAAAGPPVPVAAAVADGEPLAVVGRPDQQATLRSLGLLGLLVVMLIASYWVGLLWAAVGFVFVVARLVERVPLPKALLLAAVAGLAIWGIFVQLLGVAL